MDDTRFDIEQVFTLNHYYYFYPEDLLPEQIQRRILCFTSQWQSKFVTRYILRYNVPDTPRSQETRVLPSSRGLATAHCWYSSRGPLSRSVSRGKPVCFRVPPGTASNGRESFFQNVASGVMIAVQNHTTAMTDVRTNTQRLLHDGGTNGAFLTGIVRWHGEDLDIMQEAIAGKPVQE